MQAAIRQPVNRGPRKTENEKQRREPIFGSRRCFAGAQGRLGKMPPDGKSYKKALHRHKLYWKMFITGLPILQN